jgi:hypothetical protein
VQQNGNIMGSFMKRLFLLLMLASVIPIPVSAAILTGTIPSYDGTPLTGGLRVILINSENNTPLSPPVKFQVNSGSIIGKAELIGNDAVKNADTYYQVDYYTSFGVKFLSRNLYVAGDSFDIGAAQSLASTSKAFSLAALYQNIKQEMLNYSIRNNPKDIFPSAFQSAPATIDLINDAYTNIKSFGAIGDGITDDTEAIQNAVSSIPEGGILYIPSGKYKLTDEIILHAGIKIIGTNSADSYYGAPPAYSVLPSFLFQDTNNKSIFVIKGGMHHICLSNLSLSPSIEPNLNPDRTGKYGVRLEGSYPDFTWNLLFEQITFYNFERAISCVDPMAGKGSDWSVAPVTLKNCEFRNPLIGVHLNTNNADDWIFDTCVFVMPSNGRGIDAYRFGYLHLKNCFGGSFAVSNNHMIHITGKGSFSVDNILIENSQCETASSFIYLDKTGDYAGSRTFFITIANSIAELNAGIYLGNKCHYVSIGNRYLAPIYIDNTQATVDSQSDEFGPSVHFEFPSGSRAQIINYLPGPNQDTAINGVIIGGRLYQQADSTPKSGYYYTGDIVWNTKSSIPSNIGWICIFDGAPGLWKAFGILLPDAKIRNIFGAIQSLGAKNP